MKQFNFNDLKFHTYLHKQSYSFAQNNITKQIRMKSIMITTLMNTFSLNM